MLEEFSWTSYIRKFETEHLSDEELKQMVKELDVEVQRVCFEYGIHN
jgi:hypothetical protein